MTADRFFLFKIYLEEEKWFIHFLSAFVWKLTELLRSDIKYRFLNKDIKIIWMKWWILHDNQFLNVPEEKTQNWISLNKQKLFRQELKSPGITENVALCLKMASSGWVFYVLKNFILRQIAIESQTTLANSKNHISWILPKAAINKMDSISNRKRK